MTRKALHSHKIEGWKEKVNKHREQARIQGNLREKTFSQLNAEEKDELLKMLGERLGLLKPE